MARVEVSYSFHGTHGTLEKKTEQYTVSIIVVGNLVNGFVGNIDSTVIENNLKITCSALENGLIDDVCGRATNENIAMYIFANTFSYVEQVKVSTTTVSATIHRKDFLQIPYESYRKLQYGISSFLQGDLDSAIVSFSESICICDQNYQAYNLRGRAYRYKGLYEKAISDFDKVIMLAPNWSEGWRNKGNILLFQGKHDDMIAYFQKAVELNPQSALAANNLGYALGICNQPYKGLEYCKKAIMLKPDYKEAYSDCASLYSVLGLTDQSEIYTNLEKAIKNDDRYIYRLGDEVYERNIDCCANL